jgi:hypothetical protein
MFDMSSSSKVAKTQAVSNNSHLTAGLAPPWLCWSLTKLSPEPFFATSYDDEISSFRLRLFCYFLVVLQILEWYLATTVTYIHFTPGHSQHGC